MTNRFDALTLEELLSQLRMSGWSVAVHNDYIIKTAGGIPSLQTFWLFTHHAGVFVKGEGETDLIAVRECAKAASLIFKPCP